jgi:hypothetical protein
MNNIEQRIRRDLVSIGMLCFSSGFIAGYILKLVEGPL